MHMEHHLPPHPPPFRVQPTKWWKALAPHATKELGRRGVSWVHRDVMLTDAAIHAPPLDCDRRGICGFLLTLDLHANEFGKLPEYAAAANDRVRRLKKRCGLPLFHDDAFYLCDILLVVRILQPPRGHAVAVVTIAWKLQPRQLSVESRARGGRLRMRATRRTDGPGGRAGRNGLPSEVNAPSVCRLAVIFMECIFRNFGFRLVRQAPNGREAAGGVQVLQILYKITK